MKLVLNLVAGLVLVTVIQLAMVVLIRFRYAFDVSDWLSSVVIMAACYLVWAVYMVAMHRRERLND